MILFTGCVRALGSGARFTVRYRNGDIEHYAVETRSQNYVVAGPAKPHHTAFMFIGERIRNDCVRLIKA